MLAAFYAWFRVSLVVSAVPGCGVLVFIIGPPLYQYVTKFLIVAMSFQLRIRRNRGEGFQELWPGMLPSASGLGRWTSLRFLSLRSWDSSENSHSV